MVVLSNGRRANFKYLRLKLGSLIETPYFTEPRAKCCAYESYRNGRRRRFIWFLLHPQSSEDTLSQTETFILHLKVTELVHQNFQDISSISREPHSLMRLPFRTLIIAGQLISSQAKGLTNPPSYFLHPMFRKLTTGYVSPLKELAMAIINAFVKRHDKFTIEGWRKSGALAKQIFTYK